MRFNSELVLRQQPFFLGLCGWAAIAAAPLACGQGFARPDGSVPLTVDWSTKHVIYTGNFSAAQAEHMRRDPRLYYSWLKQGHTPQSTGAGDSAIELSPRGSERGARGQQRGFTRDWSFSLGGAGVAQNMSPAKFSFNVNEAVTSANCTGASADFVVYGLNTPGAAKQANLVALDNLYSGSAVSNSVAICGTSGPSVMFAYNASSHGGSVSTSPVLSADGKVVMFVESANAASYLNILRWNAGDGGTVSSSKTPTHSTSVANGGSSFSSYAAATCTAGSSCMLSITLGTNANMISSPFYDYTNDVMYVGDSGGILYKISPILGSGTTVAVSKVTVAAGTILTSPVLDSSSGNIFVGSTSTSAHTSSLFAVNASTLTVLSPGSIQVGKGAGTNAANYTLGDGPLVDSTNHAVFTSVMCSVNNDTGIFEAPTQKIGTSTNYPGGTTWTAVSAEIGKGDTSCNSPSNFLAHQPVFDNAYYTTPASGHLWACGAGGGVASTDSSEPGLFSVGFSAASSTTPPALSTVTAAPVQLNKTGDSECSSPTEIFNTNNSTDYLFLGEGNGSFGNFFAFTISGTANTSVSGSPVTVPSALGGTSDIIVDNIYVGTLSTWVPAHVYPFGSQILDPKGNVEQVTKVTGGGVSGASQPSWPAVGATVLDGTLTWTNVGRYQTASVYFSTLATETCSNGTNFCAVKLTQVGLE